MLTGLQPSFMCDASLSFFPLGPPVHVCPLPFESVHLAHSHQHPLFQRHWTKLKCWPHDYWLFGGTIEVVTTLAHFQNIPQPNWCHLTLASSLSVSTISSDILQGSSKHAWSSHFMPTLNTDYEMLNWKMQALYATQHCECKLRPKSEKWNAISCSKWGPSK